MKDRIKCRMEWVKNVCIIHTCDMTFFSRIGIFWEHEQLLSIIFRMLKQKQFFYSVTFLPLFVLEFTTKKIWNVKRHAFSLHLFMCPLAVRACDISLTFWISTIWINIPVQRKAFVRNVISDLVSEKLCKKISHIWIEIILNGISA